MKHFNFNLIIPLKESVTEERKDKILILHEENLKHELGIS